MDAAWIILGSGPGAVDGYKDARGWGPSTVATCNGGLMIEPRPDVLWATDHRACRKYWDQIQKASDSGAHVITTAYAIQRNDRLEAVCSELVSYSHAKVRSWERGKLVNFTTSGGMLTQYAVNHGAEVVHLVGMGGYASGPDGRSVDYYNGDLGNGGHAHTMRFYGPGMQSLFNNAKDVRFVFWGKPNYPWSGDNVEVLE